MTRVACRYTRKLFRRGATLLNSESPRGLTETVPGFGPSGDLTRRARSPKFAPGEFVEPGVRNSL